VVLSRRRAERSGCGGVLLRQALAVLGQAGRDVELTTERASCAMLGKRALYKVAHACRRDQSGRRVEASAAHRTNAVLAVVPSSRRSEVYGLGYIVEGRKGTALSRSIRTAGTAPAIFGANARGNFLEAPGGTSTGHGQQDGVGSRIRLTHAESATRG